MKLLKILILLMASSIVCVNSINEYENRTVGLKVTKPFDWQFVTADENLENLKRTKLNDSELQKLMLKYSTIPLVVMMKYPEPFEDLNPSFRIKMKPLGQLKGADPSQILRLILSQFEKAFKDFVLIQKPMETKVAGLNASYMRINYSLTIPDGRSFPTTSELWIVPRGNFYFMIGAGTRQDEKTGSRSEIIKILNSIILGR